jgi:hypothetical protein
MHGTLQWNVEKCVIQKYVLEHLTIVIEITFDFIERGGTSVSHMTFDFCGMAGTYQYSTCCPLIAITL